MDEWLLACRTLDEAGARFVVVGAFGAELHFFARTNQISTQDMDLLVPRDPANLLKALLALSGAGFSLSGGGEEVLPDEVIAAGIVRQAATIRATRGREWVDVMTYARGIDFEEAWHDSTIFHLQGTPVRAAPLEAILRSKKLAYRMKDRLFLEQFKEVVGEALENERKRRARGHDPPPDPPSSA